MSDSNINPERQRYKRRFRLLAAILIPLGFVFNSISYFTEWQLLYYLAVPMLGMGGCLLIFSAWDKLYRLKAGELAPVQRDVLNYLGENTQPAAKALGKALKEGQAEELSVKERLEQLEQLKAQELINEQEYQGIRKRILDEL